MYPTKAPDVSIKTSNALHALPGTKYWCISSDAAYKKLMSTAKADFFKVSPNDLRVRVRRIDKTAYSVKWAILRIIFSAKLKNSSDGFEKKNFII